MTDTDWRARRRPPPPSVAAAPDTSPRADSDLHTRNNTHSKITRVIEIEIAMASKK